MGRLSIMFKLFPCRNVSRVSNDQLETFPSTWVLRWGLCVLGEDSKKGGWGLRHISRRKKGVFPNLPFSKAIREGAFERGLPIIILPRVVGQWMGENQLFHYRQNRRERTGSPRRLAPQL